MSPHSQDAQVVPYTPKRSTALSRMKYPSRMGASCRAGHSRRRGSSRGGPGIPGTCPCVEARLLEGVASSQMRQVSRCRCRDRRPDYDYDNDNDNDNGNEHDNDCRSACESDDLTMTRRSEASGTTSPAAKTAATPPMGVDGKFSMTRPPHRPSGQWRPLKTGRRWSLQKVRQVPADRLGRLRGQVLGDLACDQLTQRR